jgi:hypothetical protein
MGKGSDLYAKQQQAKQLRAIERSTAAAAGQPVRKLSWTERNVLGVKDPSAASGGLTPALEADARIAELEVHVKSLEARVQWAVDRIQELQAQAASRAED